MKATIILLISLLMFIGCKKENTQPSVINDVYYPENLLKSVIFYNSTTKDEINSMVKYEYNNQGLNNKVYSYFLDTTSIFAYWTYDYIDTLIEAKTYYLNQLGSLNKQYIDNYFYSDSFLTKIEHFSIFHSAVTNEYIYTYSNGNLISVKSIQLDPYFMSETQYIYNDDLIIQTSSYGTSGNLSSTTKHYYSNRIIFTDSTFDANQNFVSANRYVYDTQGRLFETYLSNGVEEYILERNTYNDIGISESIRYTYDNNEGYNFGSFAVYEYY